MKSRNRSSETGASEQVRLPNPKERPVLIVDGHTKDVTALTATLRRLGVQNPLHCLPDGQQAIDYLRGAAGYLDRLAYPLPSALFLDLKLPLVSGWEVLEWMARRKTKSDCIIIVCTEFTHLPVMQPIYGLGAHCIIKKPVEEIDLMNLIYHFPRPWRIARKT